LNEIVPLLPP
jgi:Dullard-like phosphatase family protein